MSAKNCMPVTVRGQTFPSVKAAAQALKVKPASISSYLIRYGHLDGVGLGFKSPARNRTPRNVKPVVIHGFSFQTISEAAGALGVNYQALSKTLRSKPMTPRQSDRLLRLVMEWNAKQSEGRPCR